MHVLDTHRKSATDSCSSNCPRQDRRRKERNGGGKKNERRFFVVLIADVEKEGCHFSLYYNRRQAGE